MIPSIALHLFFGAEPQDNAARATQARRLRVLYAWRFAVFKRGWFWAYDHLGGRGGWLAVLCGEDPRDSEIERPAAVAARAPWAPGTAA